MTANQTSYSFFATCPKGLEELLQDELTTLGATNCRLTVAGVYFDGALVEGYRACLWSRLANRILLPLSKFAVKTADDLYQGVKEVHWLDHLRPSGSLLVDFSGQNTAIRNTHFGALRVKDAIIDQVREQTGQRPSIDKKMPDLRVQAHLSKGYAQLAIDLSGTSLHQRGYRLQGGAAPLKENLAAALLCRARWPQIAAEGRPLIDPMCGSGTLLIEAAMMALDIAPGLQRRRFGFERWLQHDALCWAELVEEARQRRDDGLTRAPELEIHGYDASPAAVGAALSNLQRAGLEKAVRITQRELKELKPLTHKKGLASGLLITNPPYGERLSDLSVIGYLYRYLGEALVRDFQGWEAAVFTGNPDLGKAVGLRARKYYKLYNGAIESLLLLFNVSSEARFRESPVVAEAEVEATDLAESAFANRLRKNQRRLTKWRKRQGVACYRLYDADIPEYSLAVDCYQDWVHVQEYQAPRTVDEVKAEERLLEAVATIPVVLGVPAERVVVKQRRRQSGKSQYERQAQRGEFFPVEEGPAKLLVNLHDYLDTGLFLDHRPIRLWLGEHSDGARFLNLFCYTAAATVHAALGRAHNTTSVDLSNTYLEWARRNFALNGLGEKLHQTVQADVLQWLQRCKERYDLIFMDPPSFSNSKRMEGVLDVQRDHVALIDGAMRCLETDGLLIFSNNLRRFKLDPELQNRYQIKDITQRTLDEDFVRNGKIHHCWEIRHRHDGDAD